MGNSAPMSSSALFRAFVGVSQNLPNSAFEELGSMVEQATVKVAACCNLDYTAKCNNDEADMFQSEVCASHALVERNGLKHCCEMSGPNRTRCFVEHKSKIPSDPLPKIEMSDQDQCENFKKNESIFIGKFIFHLAKQFVMTHPQIIIMMAEKYHKLMQFCCGREYAQNCFVRMKKDLRSSAQRHLFEMRSNCLVQQKYGDSAIKDRKMAQYSQKIPQASYEMMENMTDKTVAMTAVCCEGDMISCLRMRKELGDDFCSNQEIVSQNRPLFECCKPSTKDRGWCMGEMSAGEKPKDLSAYYDVKAHLQETCQSFHKHPERTLRKILFEISRRHQELSVEAIQRYVAKIKESLLQCCNHEDLENCYLASPGGLHGFKKETDYEWSNYHGMCHQHRSNILEKSLLVQYTRMLPQATFLQMDSISEVLHDIMKHCCSINPVFGMLPCATPKVTAFLDNMCQDTPPENLNPQVIRCCNESHGERRFCIGDLEADENFQPPPFTEANFRFNASVCDKRGDEWLPPQKRLLYNIVRISIKLPPNLVMAIFEKFDQMFSKCCEEADKDTCFTTELESPLLLFFLVMDLLHALRIPPKVSLAAKGTHSGTQGAGGLRVSLKDLQMC
ncbi:vitamin D-binding protein isoform X2 [Brienomyrus brachyistius]|uniref:vitamin D-binding protein isoform X2 n=1 Tax=Brienomyrus brachyistius TaxID=42636 RepID=UPI0020B1E1EE|nr:vitamin D-binding protein isoform X2 [Brienomyrus brachyistius]XP_048835952.1 vitamin D-binding protein isoform X2 [Brienomyrus brachyistius]